MTVRDLKTNKLTFLPIKDPIYRITTITSSSYFDKSALAVAFLEEDQEIVSLEIYSTDDLEKITSITGRIKI